jgi:transcriptional regulator with XRE-family HTH domain
MSDHVRDIAQRLRAMREISGLSVEEVGERLTVSAKEYAEMETGNVDIPVSVLCEAAEIFGISVTELLTGDKAKLKMFSVVRKDRGIGVERTSGYDYKSLAYSFAERKMEPLMVTVQPKPEDEPLHLNAHGGHEFHYCLEGRMRLYIGGHEAVINEGDSVYFDSIYPHAMRALDSKAVKLVVIVIK